MVFLTGLADVFGFFGKFGLNGSKEEIMGFMGLTVGFSGGCLGVFTGWKWSYKG